MAVSPLDESKQLEFLRKYTKKEILDIIGENSIVSKNIPAKDGGVMTSEEVMNALKNMKEGEFQESLLLLSDRLTPKVQNALLMLPNTRERSASASFGGRRKSRRRARKSKKMRRRRSRRTLKK